MRGTPARSGLASRSRAWHPAGSGEAAREQARLHAAATPRVVERSLAWTTRFRRLARDYERLPETFAGLHFLAFAIVLLKRFVE